MSPIARNHLDRQSQAVCHCLPQRAEVARLWHQDAVARREHIRQRGFPSPGARRGKDDHRPGGSEDLAQSGEDLAAQGEELLTAVIDGRPIDRTQHAIGQVGRPGDLQKVPPAAENHASPPEKAQDCSLTTDNC
jgi:hypothetical protein